VLSHRRQFFCACAPKSNAVYRAFNSAMEAAQESNDLEVPIHLRNAPTKLLKESRAWQGLSLCP
jgi:replication-associated recombination protein RarA